MKRIISQESIDKRKATILAKRNGKLIKKSIKTGLKDQNVFKEYPKSLNKTLNMLTRFSKFGITTSIKTLPIKYKKDNVMAIHVTTEKPIHYNDLQKIGREISNQLKKDNLNGEIGISPRFQFGWLPCVFRPFGD